jgi:UDP-glucuronate 4-epimerase
MKILVTGGAGFIGSHLIWKLLEKGADIVCVDNLNDYYDPKLKEARLDRFRDRIRFEKIDIADYEDLEKVFKDNQFDKVAHLAAQAGVRYSLTNPEAYINSNYVGTFNVLKLAKEYGVHDIVLASTSSVYGASTDMPFKETNPADRPLSIYAATKRACEVLAASYSENFDMNVTCLRFFTVYGPWGRPDMALFKFTDAMLRDEPIDVYNNGDMKRDFTYVEDIVDGFVGALENPMKYEVINLGYGSPVWLMTYIEIIEKELSKKAKINFMPMQAGDVQATYADISKAGQLLSFKPKVSVEEGVKKFLDWYREYNKV